MDFELILRSAVAGILGGDFADWVLKNNADKRIYIPIFTLSFVLFVWIFFILSAFFGIVYLIKGFFIPWLGLFLASALFSFLVSISLFLINKNK